MWSLSRVTSFQGLSSGRCSKSACHLEIPCIRCRTEQGAQYWRLRSYRLPRTTRSHPYIGVARDPKMRHDQPSTATTAAAAAAPLQQQQQKKPNSSYPVSQELQPIYTCVVVKMMVPFWVLNIVRHLVHRGHRRGP